MSSTGVIYYNTGTSCAVRLLVSLFSLRQHYAGPVTILSEGDDSHDLCRRIGDALGAAVLTWDCGVPPGTNRAYLAKTRYHLGTPFDTTLALDSDTLVVGAVDEIFDWARKDSFCVAQLGNWQTSGPVISQRLREWSAVAPSAVESALAFGPAINCGVVVFTRDASLCREWPEMAVLGREFFIPDEVCCQLLLPRHPHRILDGRWNRSCKHDDPDLPDTRIIHYHGRKHCRKGLPFHGAKWVAVFQKVLDQNLAGVREWMPAGDRMLRQFLAKPMPIINGSGQPVAAPAGHSIRVVLGAETARYPGWINTDRDTLDVTSAADWQRILGGQTAERMLAEHVWEHLSDDDVATANRLAFQHLSVGGCLRIAVPDGLHPDPGYRERVKPGGSGPSADDHRQMFNYQTLSDCLRKAGFDVECLEYWDEHGRFHFKPWHSSEGHIKRSLLHDRRNRSGVLGYTSLIVDAWRR